MKILYSCYTILPYKEVIIISTVPLCLTILLVNTFA